MRHKRNMVLLRSILSVWCVLLLACSVKLPVKAEEYTYTVRFFAGQQGTIHNNATSNGTDPSGREEMLVFTGLHFGDQIIFNQNMVTLNDGSKYYIRGLRESGKDNNTTIPRGSFTVTGDQDYVVAYGILGNAVAYTVNYLDSAGNTLAPSETYYGNIGDKAVIAYLYIDGYQPQAYNIGMTLKENASDNVINFIYTEITNTVIEIPGQPAPQPTDTENPGTIVENQDVITQGGTNFDDQGGAGNPGGAGAGDNPAGAGDEENPGGDDNPGENVNPGGDVDIPEDETPAGPEDYQDMDDDQTPLGDGIIKGDGSEGNPLRIEIGALTIPLSTRLYVALISMLAIIIGLCLLLIELSRRQKEVSRKTVKSKPVDGRW